MEAEKGYYSYASFLLKEFDINISDVISFFADMDDAYADENVVRGWFTPTRLMRKSLNTRKLFIDNFVSEKIMNDADKCCLLKKLIRKNIFPASWVSLDRIKDCISFPVNSARDLLDMRIEDMETVGEEIYKKFDTDSLDSFFDLLLEKSYTTGNIFSNVISSKVCINKNENNRIVQRLCRCEDKKVVFASSIKQEIVNHKKLLIIGSGGIGKSTLLNNVPSYFCDDNYLIINIDLTELLPGIESERIVNHVIGNNSKMYITQNDELKQALLSSDTRKVLLLFDSFDELVAMGKSADIRYICDELKWLESLSNINMIVASKPIDIEDYACLSGLAKYELYGIGPIEISELEQRLETNGNRVLAGFCKQEAHMMHIPVFYNLVKSIENEELALDTFYDIFHYCYGKYIGRKWLDATREMIFYVLIPEIAYKMCLNRRRFLYSYEVDNIISNLYENDRYYKDLLKVVNPKGCYFSKDKEDYLTFTENQLLRYLIVQGLLTEKNNKFYMGLTHDKTGVELGHFTWIRWLSAFYVRGQITELLRARNLVGNDINLNLQTEIGRLLLDGLAIKDLNQMCKEYSVEKLKPQPDEINWYIALCEMVLQVKEYFGIQFNLLQNESTIEFFEQAVAYAETNNHGDIEDITKRKLINIYCSELCGYYRQNKNYYQSFNCIKESKLLVDSLNDKEAVETKRAKAIVETQTARLLLVNADCCDELMLLYGINKENSKATNEVLIDTQALGMQMLQTAAEAGYNLASNLLGMLLAYPSNAEFEKADPVKAFYVLYNAIKNADNRYFDTRYTSRQLILLVIKGCVDINSCRSNLRDNDVTKGSYVFKYNVGIDSNEYKLVKEIYDENLAGEYFGLKGFIKAWIKIQEKVSMDIAALLSIDQESMLVKAMMYMLGLYKRKYNDDMLESDLKTILSKAGSSNLGEYDSLYIYLDTKAIVLGIDESKKELFENIEKEYQI